MKGEEESVDNKLKLVKKGCRENLIILSSQI